MLYLFSKKIIIIITPVHIRGLILINPRALKLEIISENKIKSAFKNCVMINIVWPFFVMQKKTYKASVGRSSKKLGVRPIFWPRRPFRGLLAAILDFSGGVALRAVNKCPFYCYAGIYLIIFIINISLVAPQALAHCLQCHTTCKIQNPVNFC